MEDIFFPVIIYQVTYIIFLIKCYLENNITTVFKCTFGILIRCLYFKSNHNRFRTLKFYFFLAEIGIKIKYFYGTPKSSKMSHSNKKFVYICRNSNKKF